MQDSPTSLPLLRAKLTIPPARLKRVNRPRLMRLLDEGLKRRLTLIAAPAGSGKTSLLTEWSQNVATLQRFNVRTCWLSLDDGDNDPQRFWAYVIAALQTGLPGTGQSALRMLQSPQSVPIELMLTALLNEIGEPEQPLCLALDDYQVIDFPPIHHGLGYLLDRLPQTLHVFMTTRTDPPLPLAGMRARNQLVEIRLPELRFTLDEAAEFFNQVMELALDREATAALESRTEGWVAGLQLAGLALQGQSGESLTQAIAGFGGGHRYITDYLLEQVLARQPDERRAFMMQISILDRLCASLCDSVMAVEDTDLQPFPSSIDIRHSGTGTSQPIIEEMEHANLFLLPLDSQRQWFRYHPLMSEVLRARLEPHRAQELHRRAAAWFASNGLLPEGIQHALLAKDWASAGGWIKACAAQSLQNGEFRTLRNWIEQIPGEVQRADAELAVCLGWSRWLMGDVSAAQEIIQIAQSSLDAATGATQGKLLALQAELALSREDNATALEYSRRAMELIGENDPLFRSIILLLLAQSYQALGDVDHAISTFEQVIRGRTRQTYTLFTTTALVSLVLELNMQGKRRQALDLIDQGLQTSGWEGGERAPSPAGLLVLARALLAWEADELETAQAHIDSAAHAVHELGLAGGDISRMYTQVEVQRARGETEAALETARAAWQLAEEAGFLGFVQLFAALQAELHMDLGNREPAAQWAQAAGLPLGGAPDPARESEYLTYARWLEAEGRPREALDILSRLEAACRARGRGNGLLRTRILQACVQDGLGNKPQAQRALQEAIRLAAPEGYRRAFLQDPRVLALLPEVRSSAPRFVDELLAAGRNPLLAGTPEMEEPLNEREVEVLRLIADGLTNAEIAARLVLAHSTVKWHINNLYAKLQVKTRTQALKKGKELGLV